MNVKLYMLERIVKWLVGGDLFKFVQETVASVNDSKISNDAKREYVLRKAKEFFLVTGTVFVNLAIEVAVLLLQKRIADGK